ncbi:MAG TPA: PaaI family thioesterase [Roseiarcus sp.]|nr:PaaI family thioesterase [Roseiarcus sp.]
MHITDAQRPTLALDCDEITAFLETEFPQMQIGRIFTIEEVGPMRARLRMIYHPSQLRPGGTISGPSIFALADVALYVAILAQIGRVKLAVTTNLNINFLAKPAPRDLIGEALLVKLGKRLAVGEVRIASAGEEVLAAHATGTYSIPPRGDDTVS